jgi:DNA transformation protein
MLAATGICTLAQLRRIGAVAAYARVKAADKSASLNLLWALEGVLRDQPWQVVARDHRLSLLLALEGLQATQGTSTPRRKTVSKTQNKTVATAAPVAGYIAAIAAPERRADCRDAELAALGKHKVSGSCLHIRRMADVDAQMLRRILKSTVATLKARHPA